MYGAKFGMEQEFEYIIYFYLYFPSGSNTCKCNQGTHLLNDAP